MTAIVCIEDRGGILFLKRRVGRDALVYQDIASEHPRLLMTEYSRSLFDGLDVDINLSPSPLKSARDDDVCFIESGEIKDNLKKIDRLTVYNWNRKYPSDVKLGFIPADVGFKLVSSTEFVGRAHEKITKEIYER